MWVSMPTLPHGFMADHDAACRQHLLNHAKAERKAKVQSDCLTDHLGWKAMAGIEGLGGWRTHLGGLPDLDRPSKLAQPGAAP
jgi:hypothetical protein